MATYDPDVTRWGLHLLDVCTLTNSGSFSSVTQYDQDLSRVESVREGYCEIDNVENDEAVARALQEEFTRIDCLEASGLSNDAGEHLQASVIAQNWVGPPGRHYSYGKENLGHDNDQRAATEPGRQMDDADPSENIIEEAGDHSRVENDVEPGIKMISLCSGPGGENSSYVDDLFHIFDITDESTLDGEVGKRLNQIVPVPHVPKTNEKIPSVDEEISDHQRLLERLQLYDLVELKVLGDGNCQVRIYYKYLLPLAGTAVPWKRIWKTNAPPRVAFFVWVAAMGCILTIDNLRRRHVMVIDWCCMCKENGESISHLLLHCSAAMEIWSFMLNIFGIQWVMPDGVFALLSCWGDSCHSIRIRKVWDMVPPCVFWCIWWERNSRSFEGKERTLMEVKGTVLRTLLDWSKAAGIVSFYSVLEFLDFCIA
uniref:Reverse transcriptase zinc-binding domain-containing protein n=1 Tax=Fagus sylvatica TaxID=28930 RepID=A0A2N9HEZ0_FAGSY